MTDADLFTAHRPLLFGIAYRMLGTVADAEDVVQESFLRWQRAPTGGVTAPRAYLAAVATRLCIDHLRAGRGLASPPDGASFPEPIPARDVDDPSALASLADSLSLAFLIVLQSLAPAERAVFLLREVFDFEYAEIAAIVGKSEAACRQLLHRARTRVAEQRPRFPSSRATAERMTRRFMQAVRSGAAADLMALLSDDVMLRADGASGDVRYGRARAVAQPVHGAAAVARLLMAIQGQAPPSLRYEVVDANGRPAVLAYDGDSILSMLTLDVAGDRIHGIYIVGANKLRHLTRRAGS
jgi:RNA polymerase sigma-70 factor (ECF subfamily)